tara:strand:+ start:6758 stop:7024 length:267 start_codon:yes stop_codon:yes gene_type:complete
MIDASLHPSVVFRSASRKVTRSLSMPDFFYMMSDGTVICIGHDRVARRHMDLFAITGKHYDRLGLYDASLPNLFAPSWDEDDFDEEDF